MKILGVSCSFPESTYTIVLYDSIYIHHIYTIVFICKAFLYDLSSAWLDQKEKNTLVLVIK